MENKYLLMRAIESNDLEKVREMLKQDISIMEGRAPHKTTPLNEAIFKGHNEIAKELLKAGVNIEEDGGRVDNKRTALMAAASFGNIEMVRVLLDAGAKVNAGEGDQGTALHLDFMFHDEIVDTLLEAGANIEATNSVNQTPLLRAAEGGCGPMVIHLVKAGANVNAVEDHGVTSLIHMAYHQDLDAVNALLKAGANIPSTILYDVVMGGADPEVLKVFLKAGISVHEKCKGNRLLYAIADGDTLPDPEGVKVLMDAGVDIYDGIINELVSVSVDWDKCITELAELISIFIDAGIDINAKDSMGDTVLLDAALQDQAIEVIEVLLQAGADPKVKNRKDETPLNIVVKTWHNSPKKTKAIVMLAEAEVKTQVVSAAN